MNVDEARLQSVWYVRHGESVAPGQPSVAPGSALSSVGEAQARALAGRLQRNGIFVRRVYALDTAPAVATAAIIAQPVDADVVVVDHRAPLDGGPSMARRAMADVLSAHSGVDQPIVVIGGDDQLRDAATALDAQGALGGGHLEGCGVVELQLELSDGPEGVRGRVRSWPAAIEPQLLPLQRRNPSAVVRAARAAAGRPLT